MAAVTSSAERPRRRPQSVSAARSDAPAPQLVVLRVTVTPCRFESLHERSGRTVDRVKNAASNQYSEVRARATLASQMSTKHVPSRTMMVG
jgi:hypothetical protein